MNKTAETLMLFSTVHLVYSSLCNVHLLFCSYVLMIGFNFFCSVFFMMCFFFSIFGYFLFFLTSPSPFTKSHERQQY